MAALQLGASWFPPSGVAAALHSTRPASGVTHIVHPLRRRGPSPLPMRIQARLRAPYLRFPKAADGDHQRLEPQPKTERGDDVPDAAASTEIPFVDLQLTPSYPFDLPDNQELRRFRKAFCAAWLRREAPDMFRIEKDEILNYMRISSRPPAQFQRPKVLNVNKEVLALFICAEAQEALDLASIVMDLRYIESLDHGTIQLFDQHTTNQVIRMCTSIFCHVAKAAYLGSIERDTILSFLDALIGLGVFCDTLFQQIVFKLKDGPLKNSISYTMGTHSRNFHEKMKRLKEQFIKSTNATRIEFMVVMDTLPPGMKLAQSYILQMIPHWSLFA